MADEVDITQARMEYEESLRLKRAFIPELEPIGRCHWCEEPLQLPYKFCDKACSDDYERAKRMQQFHRPLLAE